MANFLSDLKIELARCSSWCEEWCWDYNGWCGKISRLNRYRVHPVNADIYGLALSWWNITFLEKNSFWHFALISASTRTNTLVYTLLSIVFLFQVFFVCREYHSRSIRYKTWSKKIFQLISLKLSSLLCSWLFGLRSILIMYL